MSKVDNIEFEEEQQTQTEKVEMKDSELSQEETKLSS